MCASCERLGELALALRLPACRGLSPAPLRAAASGQRGRSALTMCRAPVCLCRCTAHCRDRLRVPTPDYSAPTLPDLLTSVSFLLKFALRHSAGASAGGSNGAMGEEKDGQKGRGDTAKAVYVHCNRGRSRSALVVICYLIARFGWTQGDALEFARAARKDITLGSRCLLSSPASPVSRAPACRTARVFSPHACVHWCQQAHTLAPFGRVSRRLRAAWVSA